jgi:hypothetical protein
MKLYSRVAGEWHKVDDGTTLASGLYALTDKEKQIVLFDDGTGKLQLDSSNLNFTIDARAQDDKTDGIEAYDIIFDAIEHINVKFKDQSLSFFSHLLPPEITNFIAPTDLDQAIKKGFDSGVFQSINQRPRMSMRYDVELLATSRVKRYASNYQAHLVAHSECWQQRTFTGIIPKKLKAQVSEDEIKIYENIVYARLIDHLLRYLAGAQARIQQILDVIAKFSELEAQGSAHHYIRQISKDWGRAFAECDLGELEDKSYHQMNFVMSYRSKLIQMKSAELYRSIPANLQVSVALKSTNILMHDDNYRRLAQIWRAWAKISAKKRLSPKQLLEKKQERLLMYADYVVTVVQQIFDNLSWSSNQSMTEFSISDVVNIEIKHTEPGVWCFDYKDCTIMRIVASVEPLHSVNLKDIDNTINFIITPQVTSLQKHKNIVELSPLNLKGKESLARLIVKCIWRWILDVFIQKIDSKQPTQITSMLSTNGVIHTPLTVAQAKLLSLQPDNELTRLITLKYAIGKFIRCCPNCQKQAEERLFTINSNGYFKGQCIDKSCDSVWVHDQNKEDYFKLNNGGDKDGRFSFSIS